MNSESEKQEIFTAVVTLDTEGAGLGQRRNQREDIHVVSRF